MALGLTPRPATLAILTADDASSLAITKGAIDYATSQGQQIVYFKQYKSGTTNLYDLVQQAKEKNPDIFVNSGHLLEAIEESRQRPRHFEITDGIKSRIPADRAQLARVVVAHGAEVVLLDPAAGMVHHSEAMEQRGFVSAHCTWIDSFLRARTVERRRDLDIGPLFGIDLLEAVIRHPAANLVKCRVPAIERFEELRKIANRHAGGRFQSLQPGVERGRILNGHRRIGTPGRHDAHIAVFFRKLLVMLE